ncbi:MAG TPA: hypothetical protein PLM81_03225 [Ginsengibacter sp.]|nr:hypothetical protein [Ginsengibacter sp.]HRP16482.1 hypothetical protein [Ginsengibacter sp.]HRP43882.1 hypothetical protein [Ginsengibacter sp.]
MSYYLFKRIYFLQMKAEDRRFIEYWKDQRKGSRAGYYITYIIGWAIVTFFILFFLSKLLTNLWKTGGPYLIHIFITLSIVCGFLVTHYTWTHNEKRLNDLTEDDNKEELN